MTFYWKATYDNGETIQQEPNKVGYNDIDRDRLRVFELFDIETGQTKLKIKFEKGQRLIWRRREAMTTSGKMTIVHLVGKQETVKGKNIQGLALLYEDGAVEFFEKFNREHPWLRPIELLPEEK